MRDNVLVDCLEPMLVDHMLAVALGSWREDNATNIQSGLVVGEWFDDVEDWTFDTFFLR